MNPNCGQSSGSGSQQGAHTVKGMGLQGKKSSVSSNNDGGNNSSIPRLQVQSETPLPPSLRTTPVSAANNLPKVSEEGAKTQHLLKIGLSNQNADHNGHVFRSPAPVTNRTTNGMTQVGHMANKMTNHMMLMSQNGHMIQHIKQGK